MNIEYLTPGSKLPLNNRSNRAWQ